MDSIKAKILVLDDNTDIQEAIKEALVSQGYEITLTSRAAEALEVLKTTVFDLIISDVRLPEMDGMTFVGEVRKMKLDLPIILMTAYANFDVALQAIRLGAFDFLRKPFDIDELTLVVERALKQSKLVAENRALSTAVSDKWQLEDIIGKSKKMQDVFEIIKRVSGASANVLITGESGTGKEVIAKAIHQNGPFANKPFVAINCAAIPEGLLESELFGHSKGSFTGAVQNRLGLFQEAEGGTIFLDEIGDMTLSLQAKLLRVIQERKVRPVGENAYKDVNVRIIAATHRDLKQAIKQEKFREDLFFRLNVISINVPPLRERREDIMLLAQHFLHKFAGIHKGAAHKFSKEATELLTSRNWPGNVRELENTIERAVVFSQGPEIQKCDLVLEEKTGASEDFKSSFGGDDLPLREVEKNYIKFVLKRTGGKKEKAANILGIDRTTLYRKITDYGLGQPTHFEEK